MKTNHRRQNPDPFKGNQTTEPGSVYKDTGGPNYSLMNYRRRQATGTEGMEHDGGHRGSAKDVRETNTARVRTRRAQEAAETRRMKNE
jgi:hypothetical protein